LSHSFSNYFSISLSLISRLLKNNFTYNFTGVDVDIDENTPGNVCENCCQPSICCQCMDNTGKKRQLPECNCVSCLKEICVGALAGDFDYILAKDGIVKENGKYVVKSAEQIKALFFHQP
jgi:hypothetical protein